MFAVQRFDVPSSTNGKSASGSKKPDRIALINQRKAAQQKTENVASTSQIGLPPVSSLSRDVAVIPSASVSTPAPTIHPSRLAVSHVLRQADRKAKSSMNGGVKEKTKAKQRYLKTKKERRKKRKVVEAIKGKGKSKEEPAREEEASTRATPEVDASLEDTEEESRNCESALAQHMEVKDAQEDHIPPRSGSTSSAVSDTSSSKGEAAEQADDVEMLLEEEMKAPNREDLTTTPDEETAALSRFAAPKRTMQASRKDLAAQGLPSGLAHPHRIDPTLTQSVKKSDLANLDQISNSMKERLAKMGITQWFAVQTAVIPFLLSHPLSRSLYPFPPLPDLCVSAPTGSGKTLSYAVPIVEVLGERIIRRLRALIILPTRDLVNQVKETLTQLSKGTSLSIAAITGQQNISQEQSLLMTSESVQKKRKVAGMFTDDTLFSLSQSNDKDGQSKVDILIATPGRLIDHLDQTPGFTLQHLRFLVIDEADRLLGQSFQEWLPRILDGLDPSKETKKEKVKMDCTYGFAPACMMESRLSDRNDGNVLMQDREEAGVQKLLFSATLTRDPAKILSLQLRDASFISVEEEEESNPHQDERERGRGQNDFIDRQENFALPANLKEHMIVTKGEEKPLELLHLLFSPEIRLRQALCFTKSVENAARLVKLIEFFQEGKGVEDQIKVKEYSSDLNANQRVQILSLFKAGEVDLLICSDVIARGIDLPEVNHVISYDVPVDMAKYVHRVGRTARANRKGDAWTLVEEQEARHFKTMMKKGGRRGKLIKVKTKSEDRDSLRADYVNALSRLEDVYARKIK